jgi:hypothetical protein
MHHLRPQEKQETLENYTFKKIRFWYFVGFLGHFFYIDACAEFAPF